MARYLSESDVYNLLGERGMATVHCSQIDALPRADVAPRAEFEALKDEADRYKRYYFRHDYDEMIAEAKAEAAREIFEKIEKILDDSTVVRSFDYGRPYFAISKFNTKFAELKKKYTEAEPPKGD